MFFSQFFSWLTLQLQAYVANTAAKVAADLSPAATAFSAIYVMGWGALLLSGTITEPLVDGIRRILKMAIILGACLNLWLYNDVLIALVVSGPRELATSLIGAPDTLHLLDTIWSEGGQCADALWNRGGVFGGDIGFYLAGGAVWLLVAILCVYCAFLMALAQIAAAVLLGLGPLFLLSTLFPRTAPLFDAWMGQLLNYAFVGLLVALVANLLLSLIASYATQTANLGASLSTVDVLDLLLAAGLAILLLRQILPIAAGLSRGVTLSTMGVASTTAARVFGYAAAGTRFLASRAAEADSAPPSPPGASRGDAQAMRPQFIRPLWRQG